MVDSPDDELREWERELARVLPIGFSRDHELYLPILRVLDNYWSTRQLAVSLGELISEDRFVVENDIATSHVVNRPSAAALERARASLGALPWPALES